jgi:hypothetical protein
MRTIRMGMAAALILAATQAHAQVIVATPEAITAELKARGYKAERLENPQAVQIRTADSGVPVTITFYNCKQGQSGCTTVGLYTGFTDVHPSVERINAWNAENRWIRAYVDKVGDPVIEMDVNLDYGGVGRDLFWDNMATFFGMVAKFRKEFGKQP